ncbi:MAG: hypothetical protein OEV40_02565 [Acidimicrobiia bacterium]|nr:hypothetical protein [Acidimicrobiia bacterium]
MGSRLIDRVAGDHTPGSIWRFRAGSDRNGSVEPVSVGSAGHPDHVFDEVAVDAWLQVGRVEDNIWTLRVGPLLLTAEVGPAGELIGLTVTEHGQRHETCAIDYGGSEVKLVLPDVRR